MTLINIITFGTRFMERPV